MGFGSRCRRAVFLNEGLIFRYSGWRVDETLLVAFGGGRPLGAGWGSLCVVQLPSDRIEQADEACFCNAALEERVCGQGAEGVVADLGVGRGPAAVDEGEVFVCGNGRDVEQRQPEVDSIR